MTSPIQQTSRSITSDVLDMVDELFTMWSELQEIEIDDDWRGVLETEIAMVVEATEKTFYNDEEEVLVYQQIRACAVDVESVILSLIVKDRHSMPKWRRDVHHDILDKAREIAVGGL